MQERRLSSKRRRGDIGLGTSTVGVSERAKKLARISGIGETVKRHLAVGAGQTCQTKRKKRKGRPVLELPARRLCRCGLRCAGGSEMMSLDDVGVGIGGTWARTPAAGARGRKMPQVRERNGGQQGAGALASRRSQEDAVVRRKQRQV
jgi:hypothetical protein